jgi:hypothetical protein
MSWAEALKEYAKQKGQFVVPKKDTADYKAVKAIQEKMASAKKDAPAVEEPKKPRKAKAMPEGTAPKPAVVEEAPKEIKKKAVNPALACEHLKVQQAAKEQAVEVKAKRARKAKEADPAVDAPKRKPRAKKTEIIKQDVVLEF